MKLRTALLAVFAATTAMSPASAQTTIYNNIPGTLAPNYGSLGYQANQVKEFGNLLRLGAAERGLSSVSVVLSNWALASTYDDLTAGYTHALTLNVYNVGANNTVGAQIGTVTQNTFIKWRPEASAGCGSAWRADDNQCYNGLAQRVSFDFTGQGVYLPDNAIFALAFNTGSWGTTPTGGDGPYNSLNFALGPSTTTVGSNDYDIAYTSTTYPGWSDNDPNWVSDGTLRRDLFWGDYAPMFEVEATPEPASLVLLGTGLLGIAAVARRRKNSK